MGLIAIVCNWFLVKSISHVLTPVQSMRSLTRRSTFFSTRVSASMQSCVFWMVIQLDYAMSWQFLSSCITVQNTPNYIFAETILLNTIEPLMT